MAAGPGEELSACLPMEFVAQSAYFGAADRLVKEKQVRPMEANIKHTAMALCCAGNICRHFTEHGCAEAVMGIGCWHILGSTSLLRFAKKDYVLCTT